ncbi:unnamed protein product, partial [Mesorhabditis spiculigera]
MSKGGEEELEKQYHVYKQQFEEWREKNKSSQGTDAYNAYVKQFEDWERDVEKRRKLLREKAEPSPVKQESEAERRDRDRLRREAEERERRIREEQVRAERIAAEQKAAAEAAAYAQSQQAYLAHHQAGLEQDRLGRGQVHVQASAAVHYSATAQASTMAVVDEVNAQKVLQQMAEVVMGGQQPQAQEKTPVYQQQPPQQQAQATPPQLWGGSKPVYDVRDPMFAKWGMRAAPAHQPPPLPPAPIMPMPYWLSIEEMKSRKLMMAPMGPSPMVPPFM